MAKAFVQSFLMMKHLHIKGSHVFSGILGIDHVLSENSAPGAYPWGTTFSVTAMWRWRILVGIHIAWSTMD